MFNKSKRLILGLFIIFLTNDVCNYAYAITTKAKFERFEIFYTQANGHTILNGALIFICVISVYRFIKGFFSVD